MGSLNWCRFFILPNDFKARDENNIREIEKGIFVEKVMMYLFDDLLRHHLKIKGDIFNSEIKTFSDIAELCETDLIPFEKIFKDEFLRNMEIIEDNNIQEEVGDDE